jgi:ubiquinone/menaquinone biosynthesis C-methylase UbiE
MGGQAEAPLTRKHSRMSDTTQMTNEQAAAAAFTKQAVVFDELYSNDLVVQYKRQRVRDHVLRWLPPQSRILELNAGTGEDAVFFARQGHTVHATDISEGMQSRLKEKARQQGVHMKIENEVCSFTELDTLSDRGPYDLIFSNMAGLNCTSELHRVLQSFDALLKPGGLATLVILPKFCLWEFLLLFKGEFKTALRRFSGKTGTKAHVEGQYFRCWYYSPSYVQRALKDCFETLSIEGLCTLVPPSYLEGFAERHPGAFRMLKKQEERWKHRWPWRSIGDYYIITLRKKG